MTVSFYSEYIKIVFTSGTGLFIRNLSTPQPILTRLSRKVMTKSEEEDI